MDKQELLAAMRKLGIELNDAGRALFAHEGFTTSEVTTVIETVEIAVTQLGLTDGATIAKIVERAHQLALSPCSLELGPYLRLQYLDQPEGHARHPHTQHSAPPGSLTIASRPIAEDDYVPKGFYLRRINGVLWLRGYRSGSDHVWGPEDRLVFAVGANAA
jgi:hypothetical protein